MLREKKSQIIAQLADNLSRSTIVVAASYQGHTAKEMTELRWALTNAALDCRVVKNTLVRLAAQKASKEQVMDIINGPTALLFGYDDAAQAAKTCNQYIRSKEKPLEIKGGLLGDRVLSAEQVVALANLPPREVILAQLAAQLQAPISSLHNILNSPLLGLLNVLHARAQKCAG